MGASAFCSNGAGNYSVSLSSGTATSFAWTLPAGATVSWITNSLTSSSILVQFGNTAGSIGVTASNLCSSALASLAVNPTSCDLYFGGTQDGFSFAPICDVTLNGASSGPLTLGPVSGPASFCANGAGSYSVSLSTGTATFFSWTLPAGATVVSIVNTLASSTVSVLFGVSAGDISVTASNGCSTANSPLYAVAPTACDIYFGGNSDGYNSFIFCSNTLNGGAVPAITLNAINGSATFCINVGDLYSVSLATGFATSYTWTGPTGTTAASQNNSLTSTATNFLFGSTDGNIDVTASNGCTSASATSLPVIGTSCNQYFGGNNDGYSSFIFCATDLSGGVAPAVSLNAITGPTSFCVNTIDGSYGVTLATGAASLYTWSGPTGSGISGLSNSLTSSLINISFATTGGNVVVSATDGCTSATSSPLAVTPVSCNNTLGGNNDGFSFAPFCGLSLNGPAAGPLVLGPITGSSTFCSNLGSNFSVSVSSGFATGYSWNGPTGYGINSVISGITLSTVNMQLTTLAGNISVTVTDGCSTIPATPFAITPTACNFSFGSFHDGFAMATLIDQPLPIELADFSARLIDKEVYLNWSTFTEINNDFFTVQRSTDGVEFAPVEKVKGAGTSIVRNYYQSIDPQPHKGISYYRLKQTDFDGRSSFPSGIIRIDYDSPDSSIQLFPNPSEAYFRFNSPELVTKIEIKDMTGRTILNVIPNHTQGQVEITSLPAGSYIIRFFTNKNPIQQQRMIKL